MKFRAGFVSNSSSSSFLIGDVYNQQTGEDYSAKEILDDIKKMLLRYQKANIKKIVKDTTISEQERERRLKYYSYYNEKNIDEYLKVMPLKNAMRDVKYWYAPVDLEWTKFVVMDYTDNFIPESIAKKIIKKYNVSKYNLHMG